MCPYGDGGSEVHPAREEWSRPIEHYMHTLTWHLPGNAARTPLPLARRPAP